MTNGLLVGKFYPPHAGHDFLIGKAASLCDNLVVLVCATLSETIDVNDRCRWLSQAHPNVTFVPMVDVVPIDYDDSLIWQAHLDLFKAYYELVFSKPDIVFGSDDYVSDFASRLDAAAVMLDRGEIPVSATMVRNDLYKNWKFLNPFAAADLSAKIVVLGSESSGTSTLTKDLFNHFNNVYPNSCDLVLEHGRFYTEDKLKKLQTVSPSSSVFDLNWTDDDFSCIAKVQNDNIVTASRKFPIVFADTDALATSVWQSRYLGHPLNTSVTKPALYVVTDVTGVDFEQDGLRDGQHLRVSMQNEFIDVVKNSNTPWILAAGDRVSRLELVSKVVQNVLTQVHNFGFSATEISSFPL